VHVRFLSEIGVQTRFGDGRKSQRGEGPRVSYFKFDGHLQFRTKKYACTLECGNETDSSKFKLNERSQE